MSRMPLKCDICLGREGKIQPSNRLPPLLKKHLGVIACGPVRWCESCSKLLEMWDNFSLTARRNLALSHHSIIAVNGITGRRDNHLKEKNIVEVVDLDDDDKEDKEKENSDLILLDDSESSDLDNAEEPPVQQEDSCDSFEQDEPEQDAVPEEDTGPASCISPQQSDKLVNEILVIQDVYSISNQVHEQGTEQPMEQEDDEQPIEQEDTHTSSPEQSVEVSCTKQPMNPVYVPTNSLKQPTVSALVKQPMKNAYVPTSTPEQPIVNALIKQPMKNAYVPTSTPEQPIVSALIKQPMKNACVQTSSPEQPIEDNLIEQADVPTSIVKQPIEEESDCEPDETGYALSEDEEELLRSPQEIVDDETTQPAPSMSEEQPGWPTTIFEPQCIDIPSDPLGLDPLGIKTEPADDDLLEPMVLNHCTQCKRKFTNMEVLALHFKYRHGLLLNKEMQCTRISIKKQSKYKCTDCFRCFYSKRDLKSHQKSHKKSFTCRVCSVVFCSKTLLSKHESTHNTGKIYEAGTCPYCSEEFDTHTALDTHIWEMHSVEGSEVPSKKTKVSTSVTCTHCGATFPSRTQYQKHNWIAHREIYNGVKPITRSKGKKKSTSKNAKSKEKTSPKRKRAGRPRKHDNVTKSPDKSTVENGNKVAQQLFDCILCSDAFPSSDLLESHLQDYHHKSKNASKKSPCKESESFHVKCKFCGVACDSAAILVNHILNRHGGSTSNVSPAVDSVKENPKCDTITPVKPNVRNSTKISPKTSVEISPQTSVKISPQASVKVSPQSSAAAYKPEEVPDSLKTRFTYRNSMLYCNFCLKSYPSLLPMAKHIKNTHLPGLEIPLSVLSMKSKKCFDCKICKMEFDSESDLAFHETGHKVPPPSQFKVKEKSPSGNSTNNADCSQCVHCKEYFMSEELANHMKIHKNSSCLKVESSKTQQPSSSPPVVICEFFCDFCSKKLLSKVALEFHLLRSHLERY